MNSLSLLFEITSHKSFYEQTLPKAFICAIKGFVLIQASNGIFPFDNLVFILLRMYASECVAFAHNYKERFLWCRTFQTHSMMVCLFHSIFLFYS
jgi:hypothetical protein